VTRSGANVCIGLFFAAQAGLVTAAALPSGPLHGRWAWGMFATQEPYDLELEAVGIADDGRRVAIPLGQIFRYRRGATRFAAYHGYLPLYEGGTEEERRRFCRYLARRMAERGTRLSHIELGWQRRFNHAGPVERVPIGGYDL
jgi:hypothetical protein